MAETLEKAVYHPVAFHKNQGSLTATSNGASFETEDGFELMEVSWQELEKLSVNSKNKEKCLLKLALKDSTNHILHFPSHDESHKAFHEMNLRFNNYQEQNNESAHSGGEPKEFISERFEDDEIPPPKSASTVPKPKPTSALPINANRATNVVAPGATKTVTLPIQTTVAPTKSTTPLSIVKDVENPKAVTPLAPVPREEPDEGACCRFAVYGLCLFAFGCSVVAIADCSFFLAEYDELDASLSNHDYDFGNSDSDFDFSYPPSSYYGYRNLGKKRYKKMYAFGAFTYDYDRDKHRCVAYTDDMLKDFSLATNAGRGFGVLASLLTAAVVFLFTIMLLVSFGPRTRRILWNINIIMMVIAIPSQLLTFLAMLQDECNDADLCVIGIAGGFSVLAVILFIAIAISMATCARPPVRAVLSFSEKSTHRKGFGVTIVMLVVLAFLLSVVVTGDCTFARHGGRGTKYEDLDEFGLFRYNNGDSDEHQCLAYDSDMALSAELKAGRAFGTLASLFAGTSMLIFVSYFLFLERGKRISWITARTLAILALISQALTFVVFGEPLCTESGSYQCVLGPAGILAVFNVVLLFVIVGLSCNTAPFPNPLFKVTLYKNSDASEREEPSDTHMIDEGLNEA